MNPLVSIIIPCYNQGEFLGEALESVQNQTFLDWECLIIDDGSTDDTRKIAKSFVDKDSRFCYFKKENGGVSSARNFGLGKARGEYIQFLDADDILDIRKLELSMREIKSKDGKEIKMVISNFKMLSTDSKKVLPPFCELRKEALNFDDFLFNAFSIQVQCGFFCKTIFDKIRFPEDLSAQEDWIVWLNILKSKPVFVFLDVPLAFYRINPQGRMATLGADDNQIKIFDHLKKILNYEEYHCFAKQSLTKWFNKANLYKMNLNEIKRSKSYKIEKILKSILKRLKV